MRACVRACACACVRVCVCVCVRACACVCVLMACSNASTSSRRNSRRWSTSTATGQLVSAGALATAASKPAPKAASCRSPNARLGEGLGKGRGRVRRTVQLPLSPRARHSEEERKCSRERDCSSSSRYGTYTCRSLVRSLPTSLLHSGTARTPAGRGTATRRRGPRPCHPQAQAPTQRPSRAEARAAAADATAGRPCAGGATRVAVAAAGNRAVPDG